jgi:hypothetical protein
MAPYGWATDAGIPFWVTWGNHDVETPQRIETVNQAFDDPPRWAIYEWGGVDVVVLDSTQVASVEQDAFLTSALSGSGDPAIVVFHHPPYTCGTYEGNDDIAEAWLPDLDDDVVMVLNGHDHNYQRFEDGGVAYVVTGGGGAPVYELEACPAGDPAPVAGEALHHFLAMRQGEDVIEVTVVDVNGATIDSFEVAIP